MKNTLVFLKANSYKLTAILIIFFAAVFYASPVLAASRVPGNVPDLPPPQSAPSYIKPNVAHNIQDTPVDQNAPLPDNQALPGNAGPESSTSSPVVPELGPGNSVNNPAAATNNSSPLPMLILGLAVLLILGLVGWRVLRSPKSSGNDNSKL